jgi:tetratricopeptide (TPR) repeat protein
MFYDDRGNYSESLRNQREALRVYEDLGPKDPENRLLRQGWAIAYTNIADELGKMGKTDEAIEAIEKAVGRMQQLVESNQQNASQKGLLAEMYMTSAQLLNRSNRPEEALSPYKLASQIYREMFERDPSNKSAELQIASCTVGIAKTELRLHRTEAASADFKSVVATTKRLVSSENANAHMRFIAAAAYAGLGGIDADAASSAAPLTKGAHWEAARNWFNLSLDQLNQIPQSAHQGDENIEPINAALVKKELARCQSGLSSRH